MGVLSKLCEIALGSTVIEFIHHGVIRLEFELRDENEPMEIQGIIRPQNADSIFEIPLLLCKQLFEKYMAATNIDPTENFFQALPTLEWASLKKEDQFNCLQKILDDYCVQMNLDTGSIVLVDIIDHEKVILRFPDRLDPNSRSSHLMKLEKKTKKVEKALRLYCQEKKDLSLLRRLV